MAVDHTGTTRPRCVVLSDEDMAVIRRVGKGNQSQGIRELVRMYLEQKKEGTKNECRNDGGEERAINERAP